MLALLPGRLLPGLHVAASCAGSASRVVVRFVAQHSGLPALLVAAVLLVVGWRLLRKTLRFAVEVAVVTAALVAATQLGWIRW